MFLFKNSKVFGRLSLFGEEKRTVYIAPSEFKCWKT